MRHVLFAAIVALAAPATAAPVEVTDLATPFVAFWDATTTLPTTARVAAFKRDVASRFPGFYGIARFDGEKTQKRCDAQIATAIDDFAPIRDAFVAKTAAFARELPREMATFRAAFPDYASHTPIYVLHSLGEMDGGTREIDGRTDLIFGVDGMVAYHGTGPEAAFFHHELFHTYHAHYFADSEEVWRALWSEGLAVYVSRQLNPVATDGELGLEQPPGMVAATRQRLEPALADLESALSSTDHAKYMALFSFRADSSGLPPRRGYYLGLLVADELGRSRSLAALAKLTPDQARPLVFAAVHALRERARTSAG